MAKHEKSAGAVIYYFDQKPVFLFLQNTLKTTYWEFPKGKIEKEEKIEETVKREVQEETGLSKFQIIPGFKRSLQWYFQLHGETIRKEAVYLIIKIKKEEKENVRISKEHQKFEFMDYNTAMEKVKIKGNRELLSDANKFILDFEKQKSLF